MTTYLAAAPGAENYSRLEDFLSEDGRQKDADAVRAAEAKQLPDVGGQLAERAGELYGKPGATPLYQRMVQLDPGDYAARSQLAMAYEGANNRKAAAGVLRELRKLAPQDQYLCVRLADLLRELGNQKEAIELYREAIRLEPTQIALREKLQVLLKEQPPFEAAAETPVQPLIAKAPKPAEVSGQSAVGLLDEGREVVYPDFATVSRYRMVVKVLDAAGVEHFQSLPLSQHSATDRVQLEVARIIEADGKVQNVAQQASDGAANFPSLAPGDIVDFGYRVEGYATGGLAGHFWSNWFFNERGQSVRLSRYCLITPRGVNYQTRAHGSVPQPVEKDAGPWHVREWKLTDLPAIKEEPLMPSRTAASTWLDVSNFGSWSEIVRWYQDLSRERCVPESDIRAKAAELTAKAGTEEEKLRAIVRFVQDIQYQSTPFRLSAYIPTEGKQVLRERYGDCKDKAALLTALLDAVGIRSRMVLINGRSTSTEAYLPSPRFNHAIALVTTSHGPMWVDATADQLEFGDVPFEDQEVPALVVDDATTDLTLTSNVAMDRNTLSDSHEAELSPDGSLKCRLAMECRGNWNWMLRTAFKSVATDQLDQVLKAMATQMVTNPRDQKQSVSNLENRDLPLKLLFEYRADKFATSAGSFLLAPLPWGGSEKLGGGDFGDIEHRASDVELALLRGRMVSHVRIKLPPGMTVQDLKPEVKETTPFGSYRFTYRMEGDTFVADRELLLTRQKVPAAEAAEFARFFKAHNEEMTRKHVFKRP